MGFAVVVEILNLATRGGKKHGHPGGP